MSALVDWELAARVAELAAGGGEELPEHGPLARAVAEASEAVEQYTGLEPTSKVPVPEWVTRAQWAAVNIAAIRTAMTPLEARIASGSGIPGRINLNLDFVGGSVLGRIDRGIRSLGCGLEDIGCIARAAVLGTGGAVFEPGLALVVTAGAAASIRDHGAAAKIAFQVS